MTLRSFPWKWIALLEKNCYLIILSLEDKHNITLSVPEASKYWTSMSLHRVAYNLGRCPKMVNFPAGQLIKQQHLSAPRCS